MQITRFKLYSGHNLNWRSSLNAGLNNLLDLHDTEVHREDGYWWKIEAWIITPSKERPHGIRYNLTLHNKYNKRIFGMDNAHSIKLSKKKNYVGKRYDYDHLHKSSIDKGTIYEFSNCTTLLNDFFEGVDATIEMIEGK